MELPRRIDPEPLGTGVEAAVDRYVTMTRATQQLVTVFVKVVEAKGSYAAG